MSKKKSKRQKSKKAYKIKLKPQTVHSIVQIMFWLLGGLIIVSFVRRGIILQGVNNILIDNFGWTSLLMPFIFLCIGFLMSKHKTPLGQPNVLVGAILFFLSALALTRAGTLGMASWLGISSLITSPGAFLLLFAFVFVSLVIMFNTSVDQVITHAIALFQKHGIAGHAKAVIKKPGLEGKKEMKVFGDNSPNPSFAINAPKPMSSEPAKEKPATTETLMQNTVTNLPGEQKVWKYPSVDIFSDAPLGKADRGDIKGNAAVIEQTLESFGVTARVVEVNLGPAVTQYAIEVALGTKLSKITGLERDLALALAAPTGAIRIEAPIPGRSLVGIELPNRAPEFVSIRKMMESDAMKHATSKLSVALGLDVAGKPIVADLSKMPHLLIAGQTGAGKSVLMNTFLCSLIYRTSPAEVKMILVDPKRVELTGYNNIPHLLSPVIVEPEKVISALRWVMHEMDSRYKLFAQASVRNIASYNEMSGFQAMPYIVVVIDELADIMLFAPVEVEDCITRIAQMSRATGIHMVLATQRPSVDVITGLIKANIPSRIAFAVSSQIDSRVILDGQGAEKLLGKGDMLYLPADAAKPARIQGAFASDKDINELIAFVKNQGVTPQYTEEVTTMTKSGNAPVPGVEGDVDDNFKQAVEIVCQYDRASASLLQRRLSVGYARAARIIDQLEAAGVIGPADGSKPREVLTRNPDEVLGNTASS
jgi:S-DNA-T family DNA segregation ATPase FtsK/SpoIIIE